MTDLNHTASDPGSTRLLESSGELKKLCAKWYQAEALAMDTEFERSRTFYPQIGLIQVADANVVRLLDPLAVDDLSPLLEVFDHPSVMKVLHGCSEDLEVIYHLSGKIPGPLFDTQLAAAFAGFGYSLGYRRLIQALFRVELQKEHTRSDWLRRPLSSAQLRYAALDVAYLLPAYHSLTARLRNKGRLAWLQEEMQRLQNPARFSPDPREAYLKIKNIGGLDRRSLGILQELCKWREREARSRDIPRTFVVRDPVLLELARARPGDVSGLARIRGLHHREIKRSGEAILSIISEAQRLPESALPRPLPSMPEHRQSPDLTRSLKATVRRKAEALEIPPQLLADNRTLESLIRSVGAPNTEDLPSELRGWRRQIITEDLVAQISHHDRGES